MKYPLALVLPLVLTFRASAAPFDCAPFALPLPEGHGLLWEDPREIHKVIVEFDPSTPIPPDARLEYWGSRWPQQHLPKDREPGGGDVGWMELGNWYQGGWRKADAETKTDGSRLVFTFRPINTKEFPRVTGYAADFRYTLKLRLTSDSPLPKLTRWQAFTDSETAERFTRLVWAKPPPRPVCDAFNGRVDGLDKISSRSYRLKLTATSNSDPNTLDRTLVTVRAGSTVFTFTVEDLAKGPLFLPHLGVAVLPDSDQRDYAALAEQQRISDAKTLYDRVADMPEQTWRSAWDTMPPKKSHIYFPLGLDGGRQRFLLQADGAIQFRCNDHYLVNRLGKDTPRLKLESAPVRMRFGDWGEPDARTIQEESIPVCETTWVKDGVRLTQTAFVTELQKGDSAIPLSSSGGEGRGEEAVSNRGQPVPPADTFAIFLARFVFTNASDSAKQANLPLSCSTEIPLRFDENGLLWSGDNLRGQVVADSAPATNYDSLVWTWTLAPGQSRTVLVKIPYLVLTEKSEREALAQLDFDVQRAAVASYWRRRLDESAMLITPEPILNEFYRADAGHLLINCEREPNSTRRFARVGSFAYGAYGNESCMMVVELDRRGYHRDAQECLDAWLHYQGTVGLPGDFSSKDGVLYGAGGYEAGGYNQHHGWILWMLAEHYRFTRDNAWLRASADGIIRGADWIIRETQRTADRHELERGLLPAGSLEDIGDWWTWLSTSCYTWRGLDSAAWALEQIRHPDAQRIRRAADAYHAHLLGNFRKASERSPVVRLRDGTAVPKIPSYVHRRGRSFGWICETLEGSLHLLITGALDPRAPEAEWIVNDYEDNLFLSNQYGYTLDDFDQHWFGRGGMSMQACLLLDVEPYLYRDDVKQALRAMFNAIAVSHFPDVHMNTEHALPNMGDWRGDHYKSSDEANACGWLRQIFVREQGNELLLGQAVPREWLKPGQRCGFQRAATWFGQTSVTYSGAAHQITAQLEGPRRNPPGQIRLRFRAPDERPLTSVTVNGKRWRKFNGDWVLLPGDVGSATVVATF